MVLHQSQPPLQLLAISKLDTKKAAWPTLGNLSFDCEIFIHNQSDNTYLSLLSGCLTKQSYLVYFKFIVKGDCYRIIKKIVCLRRLRPKIKNLFFVYKLFYLYKLLFLYLFFQKYILSQIQVQLYTSQFFLISFYRL